MTTIAALFLSCALALPIVSGYHPPFMKADEAFFTFLVECTNQEPNSVVFYGRRDSLPETIERVSPGGFLLIKERYQIFFYFVQHGWEKMPMFWKSYQIYRKPIGESA